MAHWIVNKIKILHNFMRQLNGNPGTNPCSEYYILIKRPLRDACLCMGDLQAPPAPHFVFLITL